MRVHDVGAYLPSTIRIMNVRSSLLSAFVIQNVKSRMCGAISHIHDRCGKFDWIEPFRTVKVCCNLK
jgi:hypothetical protein